MREPIFQRNNRVALRHALGREPESLERARDAALLWRATTLAIEAAYRFGEDLPVGAVAAAGDWVVGRYYASDKRAGYEQMHAEYMAVVEAELSNRATLRHVSSQPGLVISPPDTVVVTIEPCERCQDFLATRGIQRVAFGLKREDLAARGLVKPHAENIYSRVLRLGLPYQVVQVDDPELLLAGGIILDHVIRDVDTGTVHVDSSGLSQALQGLNDAILF